MKKTILYLIIAILLVNFAFAQIEIRHIGICDGNEVCEGQENSQNCPQDCAQGQADNYCDGIADGICDPDCTTQADPDCRLEPTLFEDVVYETIRKPLADFQSLRQPMKNAYYTIFVGVAVTLISTITLISIIIKLGLLKLLKKDIYKLKRERIVKKLKKGIKLSPEAEKQYNIHRLTILAYLEKGLTKTQIKSKLFEKDLPGNVIDEVLKKF